MKEKEIFEIKRKFPMRATGTIFSEGVKTKIPMKGVGFWTLVFMPTRNPRILNISVKEINLKMLPFELIGRKIESLNVSLHEAQLEQSYGTLDVETHDININLAFVLTSEIIPVMSKLGFSELPIAITESGKMDIMTGEFETHAKQFNLSGGIGALFGQSGCKTSVSLYINAVYQGFDKPTKGIKEVWICPGDTVALFWESSDDVSKCSIDHGIGTVNPNGQRNEQPKTNTTYEITASGDCENHDDVKVWVVEPGDIYTIIATPNVETGTWNCNIPQELCHPSIFITSITPVACNQGGSTYRDWACMKIDPDGNTRFFNISGRTSPGRMPLAGDWTFSLNAKGYIPTGNACFEATISCKE